MASVWQFVADMASASPTVLFDLNTPSTGVKVLLGWKLGPTLFEKGYASSPLRHGKRPTRSSGMNQILEIPVEISKSSEALGAQAIEDLVDQLRVDNFLKVQLDGAPAPVFFRTFGDADFAATVRSVLIRNTTVTLQIEAEPFAYGPRVSLGSFTVSNNPAAGSNPMRFDITGVPGDVPTPLLLLATSTGASGAPSGLVSKWSHFATRRRGTPSNLVNHIQGEDMTQGTGAVVTADAAFSGGSKSRIGFGTPGLTLRLSDAFPGNGTSTVEARGEYRVYARMAKTVAGDTISVQLAYGASSAAPVFNDAVTLPSVAGPFMVNLGKVPVPAWSDPNQHGFSGVSTKALMAFVGLYAARSAGSGSLDVDFLYFMPCDEPTTVMARFPSTDTTYAIDGTTDEGGAVYALNAALDEVLTTSAPVQMVGGGGFPELIPGATNRIHFIRHINPDGSTDAVTDTTTFAAYCWPRWREFTRP